jgi:septal ring factor EnvC (AmiA/AmiB activator)
MIDKDTFTVEEWAQIVSAPASIGALVVTADPSGPFGLIGEFKAILSSMQSYVDAHAADSSLMAALKHYMSNQPTEQEQEQIKQWAQQQEDQMKANRPKTPEELQQRVRESVTGTLSLLRAKGADENEIGTFKAMMISVAEATANATKEGGFLGFGGTLVSEKEQSVLTQIQAELA